MTCLLLPTLTVLLILGLRFRKIGEHINLEARITPISFKDGKLDSATSTWIGNDKTQGSYENRRTRVSLISPNVPTKYLGKNSIDSKNNQVSITLTNHYLCNCEIHRKYQNTFWISVTFTNLFFSSLFYLVQHQVKKMLPKQQYPILMPKR